MEREKLVTKYLEWCRKARDASEATLRARSEAFRCYFEKYGGDITLESIEGFGSWMKENGNGTSTRVSRVNNLKLFLRFCIRNGYCDDFSKGLDDVRVRLFSKPPVIVPVVDAERAIILGTEVKGTENNLIQRNKRLARIALRFDLRTGLRRSELLRLKPEDFRIESSYVVVKNTKSGGYEEQPIPLDMVDELKDLILKTKKGTQIFPLGYQVLNQALHRGSKKAGLSIRLHLHSLRDCFCSDQLTRNVPMQTVKDNMRHKDFSSLGHYSGSQMDDRKSAINSSPIVEGGLTVEQKGNTLETIIKHCGIKIKSILNENGKLIVEY